MTSPAVYRSPSTLQLHLKYLETLQRVTKSHKVYASSYDGFQIFIRSTLIKVGSTYTENGDRKAKTGPSLLSTKFFKQQVLYSLSALYSAHKHLQEIIVSNEVFFKIYLNITSYRITKIQQMFVDSINFMVNTYKNINKTIVLYLLLKATVYLHQLSNSF